MAKAIMVQGTMSNVGKSLVAAGLCRIIKQDGYRVAPFKAQNMALNSFITDEGLEMGRAQVMQAEAAGIPPSVLMNPILLKPTDDTKSQIIVNGEVFAQMNATEYYKHKKLFVPKIREAYDALATDYDIIVLEGAGSPAEINLKENDIVNMYMAKLAKAPVLLVGDIDRGGVFATLAGTMQLFDSSERDFVKAVIINKFRGDIEILKPGLTQLTDIIHKPVAGVIPYMHLDIDDEDSLSERMQKTSADGLIDLVVIRFPRISNFTDFNIFSAIPGVSVRYVTNTSSLGKPDLIFLPGTKNTMRDLNWMRENGLEEEILCHANRGKPIFGICGGFQMLGNELKDPFNVEHGGEMKGMGLLPCITTFEKEKTRTRGTGHFENITGIFALLSGHELKGYEIHMGTSEFVEQNSLCEIIENGSSPKKIQAKPDGAFRGNVYGSYVHGIFDSENVVKAIVSALLKEKGLSSEDIESINLSEYKDSQYDFLANAMRESLDIDLIYKILNEGL